MNDKNVSTIINEMTIKERSDGRLEGRITVNGKRKSFYGSTKTIIKNKAKDYLMKVENGYREPKKITLNEYIEYWLQTYKFGKIEPTSLTRLYKTYYYHINGTIGNMMIGDVTTKDVQDLIDFYAMPPDDSVNPLALSGLKKIKQLLNPCFKMAITEGILYNNPCDNVKMPSESYIERETKQPFSLSDEEIDELKNAALQKDSKNEYMNRNVLVILILLNTGLRAGEMFALEWSDVDLDARMLHINKIVQCEINDFTHGDSNRKGPVYRCQIKKNSKTAAGRRVLKINDVTLEYFIELKHYDERHGIISKYVCCTKTGGMYSRLNLQRVLDKIVDKTSIDKRVTLHILRHTFGSSLIRKGVRIEIVSKLMGHANTTITYNKYIHTIREEELKTMDLYSIC